MDAASNTEMKSGADSSFHGVMRMGSTVGSGGTGRHE